MKKSLLLLTLIAGAIGAFAQTLTVHCNDKGKYGYVDENGKEVVKCQYDQTENFEDGFGKIHKGDKCGYVNAKGKIVVQPTKQDYTASGGYLWLHNENKKKLEVINADGRKVVNMSKVWSVTPAKNGQRQFWYQDFSDGKQRIYDLESGAISPSYKEIELLCLDAGKELYAVKSGERWRLMNGDFINPLPSDGYSYKAEDIYSLYTLWGMLSDPELVYDYLEGSKKAPSELFSDIRKFIYQYGVTVNFKQTLPTFVWSINSMVK